MVESGASRAHGGLGRMGGSVPPIDQGLIFDLWYTLHSQMNNPP